MPNLEGVTTRPLLEVRDLQIDFIDEHQTTTALHPLSFTLNKGETLAIVGESGSGKSITGLSILRLLSSDHVCYPSGTILFSEMGERAIDLLTLDQNALQKIRGSRIAMIFQEPMTSLNPVLTCGEQIIETIRIHQQCSIEEARIKTIALFEKVQLPNPATIIHRYPHELSGGQKQRVMIAMAMSCNPVLLICDEPTTALDASVQKNIIELLQTLQQENGMSIIFITHDLGIVEDVADNTLVLFKGRVMEKGKTTELFKHPASAYTKGLLACQPIFHKKGTRLPVIQDFMDDTDTRLKITSQLHSSLSNEIVVKVEGLSVTYPIHKNWLGQPTSFFNALKNIDFDIRKGETLGLVGESGSGKSTVGKTLLQLIHPYTGKIFFEGHPLHETPEKALLPFRKKMQYIFQDPFASLNPRLQIGNALMEPMRVHQRALSKKDCRNKVLSWLEKVGLTPAYMERYPHELSGGQKQRIVIARALMLEPSFIVCDESVAALDVSVQAQILNLLNDLKYELGFTTLFISHDLAVVKYISDRIMVMQKGQIIETGTAEDVFYNPKEAYTRALLGAIPGEKSNFARQL